MTTTADQARLYYRDGRVDRFDNQSLAYQTWLALPRGVRVAFRAAGDNRPVLSHDYADQQ